MFKPSSRHFRNIDEQRLWNHAAICCKTYTKYTLCPQKNKARKLYLGLIKFYKTWTTYS